jgi:hypothetical protein
MGVTLSRSMNAKQPAPEAPDRLSSGILPTNSGRLIDQPAAKAAAAVPGEANRCRLTDAAYD